jgi:hypothetical protein
MRLSKPAAVFVLLATLVPLAYLVFFIGTMVVAVLSASSDGPEPPTLFKVIFLLHLLCMLWLWALTAFYLVYLFKSSEVPTDQRVLWAVVLLFFNMFAMPVYWYLYIWPESRQSSLSPTGAE